MNPETIVSIVSIIISSILSILSVIFLFVTIHQNHKILESSNRPYISAFMAQRIIKGDCKAYIVIKNYGQSPAKLIDIKCSKDISKYLFVEKFNPLANVKDVLLYPNNNIVVPVDTEKMSNDDLHNFELKISYQTLYKDKKIEDKIIINYDQFRSGVFIGAPRTKDSDATKKLEDDLIIISDIMLNDYISKL